MIGASIETTRASSLREVKKRIRPLFAQERAALNAGLFVDGLLGDERRKGLEKAQVPRAAGQGGVRFGRKLKPILHQQTEALARREAGVTLPEIGGSYNVSHSTISTLWYRHKHAVCSDSNTPQYS